ncbi:Cro/Cl family transcriptional regulator [Halomonas sp. QX-2]|uniref:Cro/Cl family transcriptional regulator n=1 Tax=Vreelandella sedimenti TaxID=2729618 RepID=A0A7Z0SNV3_9GAMM|nr:Cro/CI family transcriptional regulator [Halomonas sedimenti]NYT74225.1 Cro/Cl family transcriptional regulator [Halomonas sedimenti]
MKTEDAIKHFGGKKIELAKALKISPSAVTMWGEEIPLLRQYQLERITDGALKADPIAA